MKLLSQFGKVFAYSSGATQVRVEKSRGSDKKLLVLVFKWLRMGFVTCGPNEALVVSGTEQYSRLNFELKSLY